MKFKIVVLFSLLSQSVFAQAKSSGSNVTLYLIVGVSLILILWALLSLANNLMKIEAAKAGLDTESKDFGTMLGIKDLFGSKKPRHISGGSYHHLTKGTDINLLGKIKSESLETTPVFRYALQPKDFNKMSPIPKVEVEIGSYVKAGDVLFYDKKRPEIKYVAPVSGEIVEISRGEKRSIDKIVILADKSIAYAKRSIPNLDTLKREEIVTLMADNGLFPHINQRPFDLVPEVAAVPDQIFISTFDTAPLAPNLNLSILGNENAFQTAINILAKLTSGGVHLGLNAKLERNPFSSFSNIKLHYFDGPHPSGNVGIQMHHVSPLKPGRTAWTLSVHDMIIIGKFFLTGEYHAERIVAIVGNMVKKPIYVKTIIGASINELLSNNYYNENARIISGDVLSGKQVSVEGFLGFKDDQVTVIKEGNEYELFGWLLPLAPRPSISGTIPSFGNDFEFEANTNTHGEKRAFVVTGQYEEVLPMDIYPQHLMKAILANDFEKMEGLGITELTEEDVALCEFVCTSKNPVQSILRQGLISVQEQS